MHYCELLYAYVILTIITPIRLPAIIYINYAFIYNVNCLTKGAKHDCHIAHEKLVPLDLPNKKKMAGKKL